MDNRKNSKKKEVEISLFWSSMLAAVVLAGYVLSFILREKLFQSASVLSHLKLESSLFEAGIP